ncbi:MAG: DUF4157 domain-containing protein [Pseudomonadota bacterium]
MRSRVVQGRFLTSPGGGQHQAPPPTTFRRGQTPGPAGVQRRTGAGAVQRQSGGDFTVDPAVLRKTGPGQTLPDDVRSHMEGALGADFSDVRVHVGPQAASIGALAFTTGSDIYFAPGQYQPGSAAGRHLIGHELAHVVQQRQGRVRGQAGAITVVTDRALEAEADRSGARAAAMAARPVAQSQVAVQRQSLVVQRWGGGNTLATLFPGASGSSGSGGEPPRKPSGNDNPWLPSKAAKKKQGREKRADELAQEILDDALYAYDEWDGRSRLDVSYPDNVSMDVIRRVAVLAQEDGTFNVLPLRNQLGKSTLNLQVRGLQSADSDGLVNYHVFRS